MSFVNEDIPDDERVMLSVIGAIRFDVEAVAKALRSRPLTRLEAYGLAQLLEGKNPRGLRLEIRGQGKGWKPVSEVAGAYNRLMAIGEFVDSQLAEGSVVQTAVYDATEVFGLSEATIYRDLQLYRHRVPDDS